MRAKKGESRGDPSHLRFPFCPVEGGLQRLQLNDRDDPPGMAFASSSSSKLRGYLEESSSAARSLVKHPIEQAKELISDGHDKVDELYEAGKRAVDPAFRALEPVQQALFRVENAVAAFNAPPRPLAASPPPVIPFQWLQPYEQRWLVASLVGLVEVSLTRSHQLSGR